MDLVHLPTRLGGMSFDNPVDDSALKHAASIECTAHLTNQMEVNGSDVMGSIRQDSATKLAIRQRQQASWKDKADTIQARLPPLQQRAMALAREKGGSSTLMTIPVIEHGFCFEAKADFHDHIHLRYGWPLERLASVCPCGDKFSVDHTQICKLSGLIRMRHNEVTDFLTACMKELYSDVEAWP